MQSFPRLPKIFSTKIISKRYNNLLAGHFGIKKNRELVAQKTTNQYLKSTLSLMSKDILFF